MPNKPSINIDLGHCWCYPDYHWEWLCKIPETVALHWIASAVPQAHITGYLDQGAVHKCVEGRAQWLNKLAVIVENEDRIIALYKHDFACWVITLRGAVNDR
jgi:hypothetical protein